MTSKEWRRHGYKTVFREGRVFLFRPNPGILISTDINDGTWMNYDNVNKPPWYKHPGGLEGEPVEMQEDFERVAEMCYCDRGVDLCDFCAGIRQGKE